MPHFSYRVFRLILAATLYCTGAAPAQSVFQASDPATKSRYNKLPQKQRQWIQSSMLLDYKRGTLSSSSSKFEKISRVTELYHSDGRAYGQHVYIRSRQWAGPDSKYDLPAFTGDPKKLPPDHLWSYSNTLAYEGGQAFGPTREGMMLKGLQYAGKAGIGGAAGSFISKVGELAGKASEYFLSDPKKEVFSAGPADIDAAFKSRIRLFEIANGVENGNTVREPDPILLKEINKWSSKEYGISLEDPYSKDPLVSFFRSLEDRQAKIPDTKIRNSHLMDEIYDQMENFNRLGDELFKTAPPLIMEQPVSETLFTMSEKDFQYKAKEVQALGYFVSLSLGPNSREAKGINGLINFSVQSASLMRQFKAEEIGPLALSGGWVAGAMILMDAFGPSEDDAQQKQMEALFEALQAISKQIESLTKQVETGFERMDDRFDQLQSLILENQRYTESRIKEIATQLTLIQADLKEIDERLQQINRNLWVDAARKHIAAAESHCKFEGFLVLESDDPSTAQAARDLCNPIQLGVNIAKDVEINLPQQWYGPIGSKQLPSDLRQLRQFAGENDLWSNFPFGFLLHYLEVGDRTKISPRAVITIPESENFAESTAVVNAGLPNPDAWLYSTAKLLDTAQNLPVPRERLRPEVVDLLANEGIKLQDVYYQKISHEVLKDEFITYFETLERLERTVGAIIKQRDNAQDSIRQEWCAAAGSVIANCWIQSENAILTDDHRRATALAEGRKRALYEYQYDVENGLARSIDLPSLNGGRERALVRIDRISDKLAALPELDRWKLRQARGEGVMAVELRDVSIGNTVYGQSTPKGQPFYPMLFKIEHWVTRSYDGKPGFVDPVKPVMNVYYGLSLPVDRSDVVYGDDIVVNGRYRSVNELGEKVHYSIRLQKAPDYPVTVFVDPIGSTTNPTRLVFDKTNYAKEQWVEVMLPYDRIFGAANFYFCPDSCVTGGKNSGYAEASATLSVVWISRPEKLQGLDSEVQKSFPASFSVVPLASTKVKFKMVRRGDFNIQLSFIKANDGTWWYRTPSGGSDMVTAAFLGSVTDWRPPDFLHFNQALSSVIGAGLASGTLPLTFTVDPAPAIELAAKRAADVYGDITHAIDTGFGLAPRASCGAADEGLLPEQCRTITDAAREVLGQYRIIQQLIATRFQAGNGDPNSLNGDLAVTGSGQRIQALVARWYPAALFRADPFDESVDLKNRLAFIRDGTTFLKDGKEGHVLTSATAGAAWDGAVSRTAFDAPSELVIQGLLNTQLLLAEVESDRPRDVLASVEEASRLVPAYKLAAHGPVKDLFMELQKAPPGAAQPRDRRWVTPLHIAARSGRYAAVRLLADHNTCAEDGGDSCITAETVTGETPLMMAIVKGDVDTVRFLRNRTSVEDIFSRQARFVFVAPGVVLRDVTAVGLAQRLANDEKNPQLIPVRNHVASVMNESVYKHSTQKEKSLVAALPGDCDPRPLIETGTGQITDRKGSSRLWVLDFGDTEEVGGVVGVARGNGTVILAAACGEAYIPTPAGAPRATDVVVVKLAQSGADLRLNRSFGDAGVRVIRMPGSREEVKDVLVDKSGNIVVAALSKEADRSGILVARLTPSGDFDRDTSGQGLLLDRDNNAQALLKTSLDSKGRLVYGWTTATAGLNKAVHTVLRRRLPNGALDLTFGDQGTVTLDRLPGAPSPAYLLEAMALYPGAQGSVLVFVRSIRKIGDAETYGVVSLNRHEQHLIPVEAPATIRSAVFGPRSLWMGAGWLNMIFWTPIDHLFTKKNPPRTLIVQSTVPGVFGDGVASITGTGLGTWAVSSKSISGFCSTLRDDCLLLSIGRVRDGDMRSPLTVWDGLLNWPTNLYQGNFAAMSLNQGYLIASGADLRERRSDLMQSNWNTNSDVIVLEVTASATDTKGN